MIKTDYYVWSVQKVSRHLIKKKKVENLGQWHLSASSKYSPWDLTYSYDTVKE